MPPTDPPDLRARLRAAWEQHAGDTAAFLPALDAAWAEADARARADLTPETAADQVFCFALAAATAVDKGVMPPRAVAEAVRLGLWSVATALHSLRQVRRPSDHESYAHTLLPVLDGAGLDALLAEAGAPAGAAEGWPNVTIAGRLLDFGREAEAVPWLVVPEDNRAGAIAVHFDRFGAPARRDLAAEAVRFAHAAVAAAGDDDPAVAILVAAADVAPEHAAELLGIADARLARFPHKNFDDPSRQLALAWARRGAADRVTPLVERVVPTPEPLLASGEGGDLECTLVKTLLACASALGSDALVARAVALTEAMTPSGAKLEAQVQLALAGAPHDRPALVADLAAAQATSDAPLRACLRGDDPGLIAVALRRLVELTVAAVGTLGSSGTGWEADFDNLQLRISLGMTLRHHAALLSADAAAEAALAVWERVRAQLTSEHWWTVEGLLVALLARGMAAGSTPERDAIAAALLTQIPHRSPTLCDHEEWRSLYDDQTQRRYLTPFLLQRSIPAPDCWAGALIRLGVMLTGDARDASLELAARLSATSSDLVPLAARYAGPEAWRRIADRACAAFRAGQIKTGLLGSLIAVAPTTDDGRRVAGVAAAAPDGVDEETAGTILEALPTAEAEALASALSKKVFARVDPGQLPPRARERWIAVVGERSEKKGLDRWGWFLFRARDLLAPGALAEAIDRLAEAVLAACRAAPDGPIDQDEPPMIALSYLAQIADDSALDRLIPQVDPHVDAFTRSWLESHRSRSPEARARRRSEPLSGPRYAEGRWTFHTWFPQYDLGKRLAMALATEDAASALAALRDQPDDLVFPAAAAAAAAHGHLDAFLQVAREQAPARRLLAWDAVWPHLAAAQQGALLAEVASAAVAEPLTTPDARWRWLDRLDDATVAALWHRDMNRRARHQEGWPWDDPTRDQQDWFAPLTLPFVPYAARLGGAGPIAAAVREALGWFLHDTPSEASGG